MRKESLMFVTTVSAFFASSLTQSIPHCDTTPPPPSPVPGVPIPSVPIPSVPIPDGRPVLCPGVAREGEARQAGRQAGRRVRLSRSMGERPGAGLPVTCAPCAFLLFAE